MLRSCLPYLGSPRCVEKDSRSAGTQLELEAGCSLSFDATSFESKHIFVRVVHAGGRVDHYPDAVLASKLLENLPGNWLARPEVFKHPHESLICPEEYLLPGHKYYVIPLSTIHKLKRKHNKMAGAGAKQVETMTEIRRSEVDTCENGCSVVGSREEEEEEECIIGESFCSAKDFYVSKEKWSRCLRSRNGSRSGVVVARRTRILVPIAKAKAWSGYTWEPGLTSIQEVSP